MSRLFDEVLENFENWTDGQQADYMADIAMDEPDFDCEDFDCDDE